MRNLLVLLFVVGLGVASLADEKAPDENRRSVPYVDPATGELKGYVIEPDAPAQDFRDLKIRQGDTLSETQSPPSEEG